MLINLGAHGGRFNAISLAATGLLVTGAGRAFAGDGVIRLEHEDSSAAAEELVQWGLWEPVLDGFRLTPLATDLVLPDHAEEILEP